MIESLITDPDHILWAADNDKDLAERLAQKPDVLIDFTQPEVAIPHIALAIGQNVPIVVGTTGWHDELDKVKHMVSDQDGTLFYASNFSIGANIYWQLNEYLARLASHHPSYSVRIQEIHHTEKKDAPSGTAITTAEKIIDQHERYSTWALRDSEGYEEDNIQIRALRQPEVRGRHTTFWENTVDRIVLEHEAFSREGFALGAIEAARYVVDKKGVYTMSDLLRF